jgi:UDP-glucose:(heptosyl)LPS alpha-1,3-glucosyltransferase
MKIAIIRKKYTFYGGAEGFSGSFIENLADEGHEIHLFAIKWQVDGAHNKLQIHRVPAITFNSFLRDLTFSILSYYMLKKQRKSFDIIQTHDKTLYQDIYRAGDGCHVEWLGQRWKRTGFWGKLSIVLNPYHWLILCLEYNIFKYRRYKKIIAISELVKRNIIQNYSVPPSDIEVIYNGVDIKKFHPGNKMKYRSEIRQKHGLEDSDFVVLFMGSGFERKGVEYLIKAVETIPQQLAVLIAGKGDAKKFRSLIKRQKIIFCGPQKDNYKYYAAADIFVFPTIYEPFGNVHLEALASGLPVITTRNSGAAEIIKDNVHGFVIEKPEDFRALAEKIGVFLNNRDRLISVSENARRLAEEFTFEKHINKILALYERVIAERINK